MTFAKKYVSKDKEESFKKHDKILVLDDHAEIVSLLLRASRVANVQMINHSSVDEACQDLAFTEERNPFRAVFIEFEIGNDSGVNVYKALRSKNPNLPIVIMSGGLHYKKLIPIIAEDSNLSFLGKPFSIEDAVMMIRDPKVKAGDVRELLEQAILMRDTSF